MSETPVVELRSVSKTYPGGLRAVDDISLRVPAGRVLALLGASGSGKTTTLRLMNRLEEPSTGAVLVRGVDARSHRPELLRRTIGYVIQEGGLFPHRDVAANVATVPRLLGWPRRNIRRRVGEVLELVGLPEREFGRRLPEALSGGQRQRVGVARALAADPDLLLMDEPFGALDPGTRQSIQDEFLGLQTRLRKTVVLVTHDIAEAGRLADETVLLDQGHIVQRGSMRELVLKPADGRVHAFLGRRRADIALNVLRLGDILENLSPYQAPEGAVRLPLQAASESALLLSPQLSLTQVLAALANCADADPVTIDSIPRRTHAAAQIRQRVLEDLRDAARVSD
jgi:osmoprotectant transport system ATP-binding protein